MPENKQGLTELWRVVDRDKIWILYAGDVGDRRVALAYVPYRFGLLTDPQIVRFDRPAGAAPEQMAECGNPDADEQGASLIDTSSDRPGIAVVVGPLGILRNDQHWYRHKAGRRRSRQRHRRGGLAPGSLPSRP